MNPIGLRMALGTLILLMLGDFIFRGILTAPETTRNDFSETYVGSWLWRHGENFYDSSLTRETATRLTGSQVNLVLIYPPTALILLSPFSFLPWVWADTIWLVLGLLGIGGTILLLFRLGGFRVGQDRAWVLAAFIMAFSPLHNAFHMANVALLAVPMGLLGMVLAEGGWDFAAGVVLSFATALKPQLGLWPLLFYLAQFRRRLIFGAVVPAAGLLAAIVDYPIPWRTLIAGYRGNLYYWFAPGHLLGNAEGSLPFHVNSSQIVFYEALHSVRAADVLAYGLFGAGLLLWCLAVWRSRFQVNAVLAISSLLGLSFVALYHSVPDVTALTAALCWAYRNDDEIYDGQINDGLAMRWCKRATCFVFLLMMLPGHSALMRLTPHMSESITDSWGWRIFVARYFVWLLLGLNALLLYALVQSSRKRRSVELGFEPIQTGARSAAA
jgi:hypothetical protein